MGPIPMNIKIPYFSDLPKPKAFLDQHYKKLRKYRKGDVPFCDPSFIADNKSIYKTSICRVVRWKRPVDFCDSPVFCNNPQFEDESDGMSNIPSFLSAVAIISSNEQRFKKICRDHETQCFGRPDESYRGVFHFTIWRFGTWYDIVIDDLLPIVSEYRNQDIMNSKYLLYCPWSENLEFWLPFLQKAYAKILGDFETLEKYRICDILSDFTGGASEVIDLRPYRNLRGKKLNEVFVKFQFMGSGRSIMSCRHTCPLDETNEDFVLGIVKGRNYEVTDIKKFDFTGHRLPGASDRIFNLVRVKSHVSEGVYKGEWANGTPLFDNIDTEVRILKGLIVTHANERWMPFRIFVKLFDVLNVSHQEPTKKFLVDDPLVYHFTKVMGSWKEGNKGFDFRARRETIEYRRIISLGRYSEEQRINYLFKPLLKNSQYVFDIPRSSEKETVNICLEQEQTIKDSYNQQCIRLYTFKVEENRTCKLEHFNCKEHYVSKQTRTRAVFQELKLVPGRYISIPATKDRVLNNKFMIRVFSTCKIKFTEIIDKKPSLYCMTLDIPTEYRSILTLYGAVGLKFPMDIPKKRVKRRKLFSFDKPTKSKSTYKSYKSSIKFKSTKSRKYERSYKSSDSLISRSYSLWSQKSKSIKTKSKSNKSIKSGKTSSKSSKSIKSDQSKSKSNKSIKSGKTSSKSSKSIKSDQSKSKSNKSIKSGKTSSKSSKSIKSDQSKSNKSIKSGQTSSKSSKSIKSDQSKSKSNKSIKSGKTSSKSSKSIKSDQSKSNKSIKSGEISSKSSKSIKKEDQKIANTFIKSCKNRLKSMPLVKLEKGNDNTTKLNKSEENRSKSTKMNRIEKKNETIDSGIVNSESKPIQNKCEKENEIMNNTNNVNTIESIVGNTSKIHEKLDHLPVSQKKDSLKVIPCIKPVSKLNNRVSTLLENISLAKKPLTINNKENSSSDSSSSSDSDNKLEIASTNNDSEYSLIKEKEESLEFRSKTNDIVNVNNNTNKKGVKKPNIQIKDKKKKGKIFAVIKNGPRLFRTPALPKCSNPQWNFTNIIYQKKEDVGKILIEIWVNRPGAKDKLIGSTFYDSKSEIGKNPHKLEMNIYDKKDHKVPLPGRLYMQLKRGEVNKML